MLLYLLSFTSYDIVEILIFMGVSFLIGWYFGKKSCSGAGEMISPNNESYEGKVKEEKIIALEKIEEEAPKIKAIKTQDPSLKKRHFKPKTNRVDDLKIINGIGPFIEQKLNKIGIQNYEQVAEFTAGDIKKVTELIEFFPGRIERDKWVSQAKKIVKKQK